MRVDCPHCTHPVNLDNRSASRTIRCANCGKSFVGPPDLAVTGQQHTLNPLPVAAVVLLHFLTAGLFSIIYLNLLHERMPRLRRSDPSATAAIGLCFVPLVNLVWFFFSYHRLCVRINEQRRFGGLPPTAPEWLSVPVCLLLACGALGSLYTAAGLYILGTLGLFVMPVFAALVQQAVNELCEERSLATAKPVH
jgi:hypothetical protein